jgi:hypothetical protein
MPRRAVNPDVQAMKRCVVALNGCSCRRSLVAAIDFLYDYYVSHPSRDVPAHLTVAAGVEQEKVVQSAKPASE